MLRKRSYSEKDKDKIKTRNKINLSYDILQELAKEGKISAYDIGDRALDRCRVPNDFRKKPERIVTKDHKTDGILDCFFEFRNFVFIL